jgi:glycosyltransferase involved in cell wall biosynthesis
MNILFVSKSYHPHIGGVETQLRKLSHALARRHSVEVAAVNFREFRLSKRLKKLEDNLLVPSFRSYADGKVTVHSLAPTAIDRVRLLPLVTRLLPRPRQYRPQFVRFEQQIYRSVYVPKLRGLMRGKDLVHAVNTGSLSWAAAEAANAEKIPFVITPYVHPGPGGEIASDELDKLPLYERADIVFALLETDRQVLIELGVPSERVHLSGVMPLLPECVDPSDFRQRHGLENKPFVLFLGRIKKSKGVLALLNAATSVWRKIPDTHFVFAGPSGDDGRQWFDKRQDQRIRYLGVVSDQEKGNALAACDLFCMPSTAEILPAVYLEAWSYGKAVVGGTAHGLRELIQGNDAGIVVEQDPKLIAARLIELLGDDQRRYRLGSRGRALVERRFSEHALAHKLEQAYVDLCQRRMNEIAT